MKTVICSAPINGANPGEPVEVEDREAQQLISLGFAREVVGAPALDDDTPSGDKSKPKKEGTN